MAVAQSDNRFDWCDKLLEVRENYNFNECCDIVKKNLRQFKGADSRFLNDVCNRANATFSVCRLFFPVYSVNATVTYNWDESGTRDSGNYTITTTTHHTNTKTFNQDFYKNIYASCKPNTYVGRNDERFYKLSHVNDLEGGIYNQACVYNEAGLENAIKEYAGKIKPNQYAQHTLNRWSVTVCFVPVALVSYKYNGQTYTGTVNMHNGSTHLTYLVSQTVKQKAATARKASIILRVSSLLVSGAAVALSCIFWNIWAFLLSLIGFVILCVVSGKLRHTKQYFLNEYGSKGERLGAGIVGKEIAQVVVATILLALALVLILI